MRSNYMLSDSLELCSVDAEKFQLNFTSLAHIFWRIWHVEQTETTGDIYNNSLVLVLLLTHPNSILLQTKTMAWTTKFVQQNIVSLIRKNKVYFEMQLSASC